MDHQAVIKAKNILSQWQLRFTQNGGLRNPKHLLVIFLLFWGLAIFAKVYGLLPKKSVRGKHVFITGAASGLGQLLTIKFVKAGAKVTICDLNPMVETLTKVKDKTAVQTFELDVMDRAAIRRVAQDCVERFGDVDILINNAGVCQGKAILDANEDLSHRDLVINYECHSWLVREFLPSMLRRNRGHIVSIASIAGLGGQPQMTDYCASKAAAVNFMEALRIEMKRAGKNIICTTICPIFFDTGMFEGVSDTWLFPVLKKEYVAWRTFNAILQEEGEVAIPHHIGFLAHWTRAFLPTSVGDYINYIFTGFTTMNNFVGRRDKNSIYKAGAALKKKQIEQQAPTQQAKSEEKKFDDLIVDVQLCRVANGDPTRELDMDDASAPLYEFQNKLPTLPVPDLNESCEIYLKSVKPLCKNKQEFKRVEKTVKDFLAADGMGPILQKRLEEKNEFDKKKSSWLATWWNVNQYLTFREPCPINVSYYLQVENKLKLSQLQFAAQMAYHLNAIRLKIADGSLPQDNIRGKQPLCASAYKYLFNTCRIPAPESDVIGMYDPKKFHHMIVLHKNNIFSVELKGKSIGEIVESLELIQKDVKNFQNERPVGVCTAVHRDAWTAARKHLISDPLNRQTMKVIESSAFAICLDDNEPDSQMSSAQHLLLCNGANRWFDKTCQLVVFANGRAGFIAEHALIDATVVSRVLTEALAQVSEPQNAGGVQISIPMRQYFKLDAKSNGDISDAQVFYDNFVAQHHLHTNVFTDYGANAIKKMGFSPDAFVQMAIQYAYRKMTGHYGATYESVQVRKFRHARTECVRSCSEDSAAWIDAMLSGTEGKESDCLNLLKKAAQAHTAFTKLCQEAKACDRHLYGLSQLLKEGESAEMFKDPLFKTSGSWEISTSNMSHDAYEGFGFGQVVPYGIGCGYGIKAEKISFNCTTRRDKKDGSPEKMCQLLSECLLEMQSLAASGAK